MDELNGVDPLFYAEENEDMTTDPAGDSLFKIVDRVEPTPEFGLFADFINDKVKSFKCEIRTVIHNLHKAFSRKNIGLNELIFFQSSFT
jgi:hypothetical protein